MKRPTRKPTTNDKHYNETRARNNAAVQKSREKSRAKHKENEQKILIFREKNNSLIQETDLMLEEINISMGRMQDTPGFSKEILELVMERHQKLLRELSKLNLESTGLEL